MAVLTKEDFLSALKSHVSEDDSDETIGFIEDMKDTYDDLANKANDTTDWKQKFEDNDKAWREKYKERFFSSGDGSGESGETYNEDDGDDNAPKTFEDLFSVQ